MRVISAQVLCTDATLLDAFRHHLVTRDLAPTTVRAYLSDLERFRTWLAWVHEGTPPRLTQVRTVDLAAFRTYWIHEQAHTPATVNRRLQGLRLVFRWLYDHGGIAENPAPTCGSCGRCPPSNPRR
jgi:site-specific recombinase XerD